MALGNSESTAFLCNFLLVNELGGIGVDRFGKGYKGGIWRFGNTLAIFLSRPIYLFAHTIIHY